MSVKAERSGAWGFIVNRYFGTVKVGVNEQKASLVSVNRVIQTSQNRVLLGEGRRFGFQLRVKDFSIGICKKRRSIYFFRAKEALKRISDLGQDMNFGSVVLEFDRWRENYREKYVHLSKEEKHVFIKSFSRFDSDYRSVLRKKLRLLNFMVWDLKIELTIDPKKFFRVYDEFLFINKAWNKLRSWLHRRYGCFEYFKVLEITKAGRPHFHILISGIKWIPQKELSEIWDSYGGGKIVYVKRVSNRNNVKMSAYVLKYVNKTLRNTDKVYCALLFASNRRLFSISSGCQNMINAGRPPKVKKGFIYEGTVLKNDLVAFTDERNLELGYYLLVEAETRDYYDFPLVFGVRDHG